MQALELVARWSLFNELKRADPIVPCPFWIASYPFCEMSFDEVDSQIKVIGLALGESGAELLGLPCDLFYLPFIRWCLQEQVAKSVGEPFFEIAHTCTEQRMC